MRPNLTFNQISKQSANDKDKTCNDKFLRSRPITLTNSDRPERMIPSDTIGQMTCPSTRLVSTFPAQWILHHTEPWIFLSPSTKPTVKSKTRSVGPGRYFNIFLTKDQRWGKMYVLRQNTRTLTAFNEPHRSVTLF